MKDAEASSKKEETNNYQIKYISKLHLESPPTFCQVIHNCESVIVPFKW